MRWFCMLVFKINENKNAIGKTYNATDIIKTDRLFGNNAIAINYNAIVAKHSIGFIIDNAIVNVYNGIVIDKCYFFNNTLRVSTSFVFHYSHQVRACGFMAKVKHLGMGFVFCQLPNALAQ